MVAGLDDLNKAILHWQHMRDSLKNLQQSIRTHILDEHQDSQRILSCVFVVATVNQNIVSVDSLIKSGYLSASAANIHATKTDSPSQYLDHLRPTHGIMTQYLSRRINRHLDGLYLERKQQSGSPATQTVSPP